MAAPIITLTTDFGAIDPFVGMMKGVILGINPGAVIVDLTHEVPPQDIRSAAFLFDTAYTYFPAGAIHIVVVDPGVGTSRRPLLVTSPSALFVVPDNGLLSYAFAREGGAPPTGQPFAAAEAPLPQGWQAWHLTEARYWRHPVSSTFHGRDIFAPVAAWLSTGIAPSQLGESIDRLTVFAIPRSFRRGGKLAGAILHIDRFGNLTTNIRQSDLPSEGPIAVEVGRRRIESLSRTYQDGGELVALVGSHGYVEIARRNGSAAQSLGVRVGDGLQVHMTKWQNAR